MKLARPDIRHPRIWLAGASDGDDAGQGETLRVFGILTLLLI